MKPTNPIIEISTTNLSESEILKLRIHQLKAKYRELKINDIWAHFKHEYPELNNTTDKNRFRACLDTRQANQDITDKLESLYEKLKR